MKKILLPFIILLFSVTAYGQSKLHRQADDHFKHFDFVSAVSVYQRILCSNPADQKAKARLAQCYDFLMYRKHNTRGKGIPSVLAKNKSAGRKF